MKKERTNERMSEGEREMKERKKKNNQQQWHMASPSWFYIRNAIITNALHKINDAIVWWNGQNNIEENALAALHS